MEVHVAETPAFWLRRQRWWQNKPGFPQHRKRHVLPSPCIKRRLCRFGACGARKAKRGRPQSVRRKRRDTHGGGCAPSRGRGGRRLHHCARREYATSGLALQPARVFHRPGSRALCAARAPERLVDRPESARRLGSSCDRARRQARGQRFHEVGRRVLHRGRTFDRHSDFCVRRDRTWFCSTGQARGERAPQADGQRFLRRAVCVRGPARSARGAKPSLTRTRQDCSPS